MMYKNVLYSPTCDLSSELHQKPHVRRSLRGKIITVYVTVNRSTLICINYRAKNRYLTYRRATLRNGRVRENKSIYRVYHVEWNSVIVVMLRSDELCRLPCGTQFREHRLYEALGKISCCTELISLSALHAQCHVTNTLAVTITNLWILPLASF